MKVVVEAKDDNDDLFKNEIADLIYHTLILLNVKNRSLNAIEFVLSNRNTNKNLTSFLIHFY